MNKYKNKSNPYKPTKKVKLKKKKTISTIDGNTKQKWSDVEGKNLRKDLLDYKESLKNRSLYPDTWVMNENTYKKYFEEQKINN